jgi:hypothetical protein
MVRFQGSDLGVGLGRGALNSHGGRGRCESEVDFPRATTATPGYYSAMSCCRLPSPPTLLDRRRFAAAGGCQLRNKRAKRPTETAASEARPKRKIGANLTLAVERPPAEDAQAPRMSGKAATAVQHVPDTTDNEPKSGTEAAGEVTPALVAGPVRTDQRKKAANRKLAHGGGERLPAEGPPGSRLSRKAPKTAPPDQQKKTASRRLAHGRVARPPAEDVQGPRVSGKGAKLLSETAGSAQCFQQRCYGTYGRRQPPNCGGCDASG